MVLAIDSIRLKVVYGAVAVCAWCQKVRDEGQNWQTIDANRLSQAGVDTTHTICPDCMKVVCPSLAS
jgi:hypothetical protein